MRIEEMVRIILCGCNGKMGQVISDLVKVDEAAEIVAGIDVYTESKNGYPVYEILEYKDNTRAIVLGDDNKSIIWEESSQYIKSIVTKEQFESMKYSLEG